VTIYCKYRCGFHWEDLNLQLCRPTGKLVADKMNDIAVCRECIQSAGNMQINRFHDLTAITSIDLSFEHIREICEKESKFRKFNRPIKACYLVPNALLYGTIRMYEALIESSGVEVHVSYEIEKLAAVLGVDKALLIAEPNSGDAPE